MFVAAAGPVCADEARFAAGTRVEGHSYGASWDRCTVIVDRPTGGYLLRCDGQPGRDVVFSASDVRALQGADPGPPRNAPAHPPIRANAAPPAVAAAPPAGTTAAAEDGAFKAIRPRVGVYACYDQVANEVATLQWGLLDGSRYSTYDGGRGRYTYASQSGILTFASGPFVGLRRLRVSERSFRILDERGKLTANVCPWTPKDPRKKHW